MKRNPSLTMSVRVEPAGEILTFTGRDAWALQCLVDAGERGVTPLDAPGPRWSGYVHKLRKAGLVIETIPEGHGDPFPGTHARYVLRSNVTVLPDERAAA